MHVPHNVRICLGATTFIVVGDTGPTCWNGKESERMEMEGRLVASESLLPKLGIRPLRLPDAVVVAKRGFFLSPSLPVYFPMHLRLGRSPLPFFPL